MHTLFTKCTRLFFAALIMFLMVGMSTTAWGQTLESFNYSTGQLTAQGGGANVSGGVWVNNSGTTGTLLQVNAGNLSYAGYPTSVGNHLSLTNPGAEDSYRSFPSSTGTVYVAFLLNVTNTTGLLANSSTVGEYFTGLIDTTSTTNFVARFSIKLGSVANTFQLGMRHNSANTTTNFYTTDLAISTTHLIVIKYEQPAGNANNIASVFVDPTVAASEPASQVSQTSVMVTDPVNVGRFFFRQSSAHPNCDIDEIRFASSWAAAVGATCPTITLGSISGGSAGVAYSQFATASGGASPYTYTVTAGSLPSGLSLNASTGEISGTTNFAGNASFTITATDANSCTGVQAYTPNFACPVVTVDQLTIPNGTVNSAYSTTLTASGGTAPYAWTIASGALPAGLTLSSGGTISGTPTVNGNFTVMITATDTYACWGQRSFSFSIACPTITITPTHLADGATGTGYSQSVSASGGVGSYTYALTGGALSTGLTLSSGGLVSGTPADSGWFYFQVTATDANSCTGVQAESVYIANTFVCPTITVGASGQDGFNGHYYTHTYSASGGTAPYSYAITAGSAPNGTSLSSGGVLSGTLSATGTYIYTITATDANSCTGTFADTVEVVNCPTITLTASLPGGTQGTAYSQGISASGGVGPYTYTVTSGSLPNGLTLTAGTLSGTPTLPGNYNFTVTAMDADSCTGAQAYSVVIACPTITVNPASITGVNVGTALNTTFTSTGGTAAYTYTLTAGAFPTGTSLTGAVLSGTTTAGGTYNFTITSTDANGCTGTRAYTVTIGSPAVFKVANVTGTGGSPDTLDWRSTATWQIVSGTSVTGFPKRRDIVILDNTNKLGDYVITVGTSAADSVKQIIVGYSGNTNSIKLLARANSNQTNPLTFGDSTSGNYDMDVQQGGTVEMQKPTGRYNILGFSTAGDSVRIAPGGAFYHHSSGSLSGVLIGLSKDVSVAKGTFTVKLPKTIVTPFNFSWAGGVYPNLVLDGDSLVTYQGSTSLASAFGECVIAGDVTIMPNARWIMGNAAGYEGTIWVKGNITNNGIIAFTNATQNKIGMIGTSAQTIGGNAITLGGGLFVGNSAGVTVNTNVTSLGNVQTSGTLNYLTPQFPLNIVAWPAAGTLSTGSSTISINPAGSLTEGTNPILGKVSATRVLALSTLNAFGNIGYEVNATGVAPDTTTIVRTTGGHLSGYLGHQSINRYYDITAKNGGSNSTIGVSYAASELNGLNEADLLIHRSSDLGTSWSGASGSVNTGTHKITASGVIGLTGRWTAGETSNPLFVSHNLLVKKVADGDGDINTTGDQVAARWRLSVYADSLTGTLVATGNPPSGILAANALPAGNYVVVESDSTSAGWITLGNYHAGINAGSSKTVNVTLAGGVNDTVVFVNQKTASLSIAKMVSTDGVTAGSAHVWGLELYKGSIAPANRVDSVNASSLTAVGLQAGMYIAVEADSGASWSRINGNTTRFDTITIAAASTVADTFVNFQANSIVVTNYLDADGSFGTTGDRTLKAWHIDVHAGSVGGTIVKTTETGSLSMSNVGDGTYYVVSADTTLWTRLGYVLSGSPVASSANTVAVTVAGGQAGSVTFVQASPSYSVKYRTFLPNLIPVDVDNKGKAGKVVVKKLDKYIFAFSMVPPDTGITGVHIELAAGVDTTRAFTIDQLGSKVATDTKLMKWDITFADTVGPTDTIGFMGFSAKKVKLSKYSWLKHGVATTAKPITNKTIVVTLEAKLPMPNRINVFNTALATGVTIGVPHADSLKNYGWIANTKAGDAFKNLAVKGVFPSGQPRGFGLYPTGKPILKANKSILVTKFDDVLISDLIALKLNIAASAMSITPNGFGELLYNDGTSNPFNGKMVKEISALADTMMMGRYDSAGTGVFAHVFADSARFNRLHEAVAAINGGFEGAIDTISWSSSLVIKGTQLLKDVTFLHANPSVAPAKITPAQIAAELEPEVYALYQNYPNPFNPTTNIRFDLPLSSVVTLKIYNILGQEVATLLNHEQYESGIQEVTFNASRLASGVYFYRLEASSVASEDNDIVGQTYSKVSKMLLIK